jgi:drug/metabolite transporter (DMT)-like permease
MWLIYAILASFAFGLRGIIYQVLSHKPADRNLILLGMFITGTLVSLTASFLTNSIWSSPSLLGILMGVLSYVGNTAMYRGYSVGKTSIIALILGLPSVVVAIFAYFLWNEKLSFLQLCSLVIIVGGVLWLRKPTKFELVKHSGVGWGLLALFVFSLSDLTSKQAMLQHAHIFPFSFFMFITASCLFSANYWLSHSLTNTTSESADSEVVPGVESFAIGWSPIRTIVTGMAAGVVGIVGILLSMGAFRTGITGLVSAVMTSHILLIILYASIIQREKLKQNEIVGICIVLSGILILVLN